MDADLENRYGPSWTVVQGYIERIPHGFLLNRLGEPHARDRVVKRICSWDALREVVDYSFPDAGPESSEYLRFLGVVDGAGIAHKSAAKESGLELACWNAVNDAGERYANETDGRDETFLEFTYEPAYDEPYPYCRYSIQDHCAWIATEFVVAHLTSVHLLRDMWFWYQAGHWPCGWEGNWPDGRLIVF